MEVDKWVGSYKIRSFPWIDGKCIYFNVQYYRAGQSISQPPVWDKTVYITDNIAGQRLINEFMDSLINYIAKMQIPKDCKVVITA